MTYKRNRRLNIYIYIYIYIESYDGCSGNDLAMLWKYFGDILAQHRHRQSPMTPPVHRHRPRLAETIAIAITLVPLQRVRWWVMQESC